MNELAELASMRAKVTGSSPENLQRARAMLTAEIGAAGHPARRLPVAGWRPGRSLSLRGRHLAMPNRLGSRPRFRPVMAAAVALAAAAGITTGLLTHCPASRPGPAGAACSPQRTC